MFHLRSRRHLGFTTHLQGEQGQVGDGVGTVLLSLLNKTIMTKY